MDRLLTVYAGPQMDIDQLVLNHLTQNNLVKLNPLMYSNNSLLTALSIIR